MSTDVSNGLPTVVVCIRFTVDVEQIKVDPATGGPDLEHADWRINEFDRNGIEAALALRDLHGGRVLGLSLVAHMPPEGLLVQGLAMGLDELYVVCDAAAGSCDALATATILAAAVGRLGQFDLVVCGDTSVDEYRGEVGPRLAEALGVPSLTYVNGVAIDGGHLRADRALENWVESVDVVLPALVTVGSETNQPRMPTLREIKVAARKPVIEWRSSELLEGDICAGSASRIETVATYAPPSMRKRIVVKGESVDVVASNLVRHLLQDAAVKF